MKKWIGILAVAALALAMPLGVLAGDAGKNVELTGYITDMWCGKANANAEGAGCIKACAKKGSDLAIFSEGKLYKLTDKDAALEHVGYEVVVTGTLHEDGSITARTIKKAKKA